MTLAAAEDESLRKQFQNLSIANLSRHDAAVAFVIAEKNFASQPMNDSGRVRA